MPAQFPAHAAFVRKIAPDAELFARDLARWLLAGKSLADTPEHAVPPDIAQPPCERTVAEISDGEKPDPIS